MSNKKKTLPAEFTPKSTDIDTIDTTKERLYLFQLLRKDYEIAKQMFEETNQKENITQKHELILSRNSESKENVERVMKNFEQYLDSLNDLEVNNSFFKERKNLGSTLYESKISDEQHMSMHVRILEQMIPEIVENYSYDSKKMTENILSLIKTTLFDYRLTSKFKNELTNLEIIKNINQIMDSIMKVNKTNELILAVNKTTEQTDNVASATEELSASVQSILNTVESVSVKTTKLLDEISDGQKEIEHSLNDIFSLNQGFTRTKANINDLVTDIQNISKIIELIKNISEQTTLLAINASIEASRAGESGKGFSVIADEIRILSEQTTDSVEDITKFIKNVEEDSRKVDRTTEELFEELREKTQRARSSLTTLDGITKQTRDVGEFTKNIKDVLREQFEATERVKEFLEHVIDNSSNVKKLALGTGKSVYDISKEIEVLRLKTIELIPDLRHKHFLNIVKTEEKMELWWIYNSLLGFHNFDNTDELSENETRFWEWYSKAKNNPNLSVLFSFKKLEEEHLELYHLEEKVRYLIAKNKMQEAQKLLPELEIKTDEISHLIEIIEKEM